MNIIRIASSGNFRIYKRDRGSEKFVPMYFVYDVSNDTIVQEFRLLSDAKKFLKGLSL